MYFEVTDNEADALSDMLIKNFGTMFRKDNNQLYVTEPVQVLKEKIGLKKLEVGDSTYAISIMRIFIGKDKSVLIEGTTLGTALQVALKKVKREIDAKKLGLKIKFATNNSMFTTLVLDGKHSSMQLRKIFADYNPIKGDKDTVWIQVNDLNITINIRDTRCIFGFVK